MKLFFLYLMQVLLTMKRNRLLRAHITADMATIGDFGCGHFANRFANVLVDKLGSKDEQRGGLKLRRQFSGKTCHDVNLNEFPYPFRDKEFDFLICSHVLEHLDDPVAACREFSRIAKAGYIEVPFGAIDLFIRNNDMIHRWLCSCDSGKTLHFMDRKNTIARLQPCAVSIFIRFIMQLKSISIIWKDEIRSGYMEIRNDDGGSRGC